MKALSFSIPSGFCRWLPLLCWLAAASTSMALHSGDFTYEMKRPDANTVSIMRSTGAGYTNHPVRFYELDMP